MLTASQTVKVERYELSDGLMALTFADAEREAASSDLPLAVVLHGLGSRKERHLDVCLRLARAGFLACAVDARFHGERGSVNDAAGAALQGGRDSFAFALAFAETVRGTTEDVVRVGDYFGRSAYGIIGHSMGGFIALQTALADPRAVSVVCVSGSIDIRPPVDPVFLPDEIAAMVEAGDPANHAARFWPCRLLLLHGDNDPTVPVAGAQRLYGAAKPFYTADPSRLALEVLPGVGHEWTPTMAERSVAWLTESFAEK